MAHCSSVSLFPVCEIAFRQIVPFNMVFFFEGDDSSVHVAVHDIYRFFCVAYCLNRNIGALVGCISRCEDSVNIRHEGCFVCGKCAFLCKGKFFKSLGIAALSYCGYDRIYFNDVYISFYRKGSSSSTCIGFA